MLPLSFAPNPSLSVALAFAVGVIGQSLARHLRIPSIVLLLIIGFVLGPEVVGLIQPNGLGPALHTLVSLGVAIILFEGGLSLNLGRLRHYGTVIRRVITAGAAITAVLVAAAATWLLDWPIEIGILFGALACSTGPTVIQPLLRRIRVKRQVQTLLETEGVVVDPLSAIAAVVALEVLVAGEANEVAFSLLGMPLRLIFGAVFGLVGGFAVSAVIQRDQWVPEEFQNIFTLSLAMTLFAVSNAIVPDSGVLTVATAGFVVGNSGVAIRQELREFKEQITLMLIGMIFVLLAADMPVVQVTSLGWEGVAVIALLMFLIRPIAIMLTTHGSTMTIQERAFVSWLGPRGIVAAAMSTLFATRLSQAGFAEADEFRALVLLMIALSVIVLGVSGAWVAKLLGIRRPENVGFIVVGANAVGRSMAQALGQAGQEAVLIDTNVTETAIAEKMGLRVILGDATKDGPLLRGDIEGRRGFIALTTNEGVNLMLAQRVRSLYKLRSVHVAVDAGRSDGYIQQVRQLGGSLLFGRPANLDAWAHAVSREDTVQATLTYHGEDPSALATELAELTGVLPLMTLSAKGKISIAHDNVPIYAGDKVIALLLEDAVDASVERLREQHWEIEALGVSDPA